MNGWKDTDKLVFGVGGDAILERTGAAALKVSPPNATSAPGSLEAGTLYMSSPKGAQMAYGVNEEEITLATNAATVDSSASLLPANSIIDAVGFYTTTTIGTAANFTIGDATTAARFIATSTKKTAGDSDVSTIVANTANTNAAGPVQVAAAKVRITCNTTPSAGAIRVSVFYRKFTAPTS